jgi:hypothetical protein
MSPDLSSRRSKYWLRSGKTTCEHVFRLTGSHRPRSSSARRLHRCDQESHLDSAAVSTPIRDLPLHAGTAISGRCRSRRRCALRILAAGDGRQDDSNCHDHRVTTSRWHASTPFRRRPNHVRRQVRSSAPRAGVRRWRPPHRFGAGAYRRGAILNEVLVFNAVSRRVSRRG